MKNNQKTVLDYLAELGAWGLGIAMFIYLGYRTLNFLSFTFSEQDQVYKWLGMFSTTIGAVIFAVIWKRSFYFDKRTRKWRSDEFRKSVSMAMMVICALGEAGLAYADVSLTMSKRTNIITLSPGELNTFIVLTIGLAFLVGLSIAAIKLTPPHPRTDPEIDMSELDMDNNGVLDRNETLLPINQKRVLPQNVPQEELEEKQNPTPRPPQQDK